MKKQIWLLLWLIPVLMGCRQETQLEQALQQSGAHRPELEKVLAYFSRQPSDSLELQAARFLIGNMPGHTTPQGSYIQQYKAAIQEQLSLDESFQRVLFALPARHPNLCKKLTFSEDIQHIDPEELIRHIRTAFRQRAQLPYLQEIDFNVFCESVLPYTMAGYDLRKTWETPPDFCKKPELLTRYYDDCRYSVAMVAGCMTMSQKWPGTSCMLPDSTLGSHTWTPNEREKAKWIACCLAGIPAALDYIPEPELPSQSSCWVCYLDPRLAPTLPDQLLGKKIGKIFRHTYTAQQLPEASDRETIPAFFRNPFCKDVTSLYLKTAEVQIVPSFRLPTRYMYLAIYDGEDWSPVSFSPVEHNCGRFAHLGKNCIYLPVYFPGDSLLPLSPPFLLDSQGESRPLVPNPGNPQSLRLDRLRPYIPSVSWDSGKSRPNSEFNICPSHRYELQYYGEKGWLSAGICEADSFEIEFSSVPAQALYRLRDLTQNLNGHIFTWENGKYIFW